MLLKKIMLKAAAALLFPAAAALQAAPSEAAPPAEQTVPASGQGAPRSEQTVPASGQDMPPAGQAAGVLERTAPASGHSASAAGAAVSPPDFAGVQQRLRQHQNLSADFVQEKILKNLQQTLRSRGRVLILAGRGIYWKQTAPFGMEMVVTGKFISQQLPGKKKMILDERSSPRIFEFASLLAAITTADREELEKHFSVTFGAAGAGEWQLYLVPREGVAAEVFSAVEIRGGDFLREIVLHDMPGDVTTIEFSGQTEVVPDAQLRSYFEP